MKPKERIPGRSRPVVYRWGVRHISGEGVSWGFAFAKHGVAQAVSIKPEGIIPEGGGGGGGVGTLHVKCAESRNNSVFYACLACFMNRTCKHLCYIQSYTVTQAEYSIRIRMAASQEYVNTYFTRRVGTSEYTGGGRGGIRGLRLSQARRRAGSEHEI